MFLSGATVLLLNATDLDRSREYGQESIIYTLEGSPQFRINARSGDTFFILLRKIQSTVLLDKPGEIGITLNRLIEINE